MLGQLKEIADRYEALVSQLEDPSVYADPARLAKLTREQKELTPVVEAYQAYCRVEDDLRDAQALLSDPEMKEMAQEELQRAKGERERLREELKILLLPKDPNDSRNVIMEIRGGVGGEEAMLFAADLFRMYTMYVESRGWKLEVANANETELGGLKEISFTVEGEGAWSRLKYESGTHRVQRVPVTESSGRIQTSAATVAVLPEAEEVEFTINPNDLQIDTFRSSGAGGQHVNKTESAIRITHIPTGVVVSCQTERSQHQNREYAMRMLRSKLVEIKMQQHAEKIADIKGVQMKIEWGSQIRSYVFMPYTLAKDHRTGYENGNIQAVMDGDIDGFITTYLTANATGDLKK